MFHPANCNMRLFSPAVTLVVFCVLVHGLRAQPIPDRYIVQVAPGIAPAPVATGHGLAPDFVYQKAINGFAVQIPPGRVRALLADARVASVLPDRPVFAHARPGGAGSGGKTEVVPAGVERIGAAPGTLPFTGNGVGVAIVDTGLDFRHSDLQPLGAASFSAFGASAQDDNGHGTHVGGTVGARHNGTHVVGVAPDTTLYAVKVLDGRGGGADSTILAGIEWILQNANEVVPPIRVANFSLGRFPTPEDDPLAEAIQNLLSSGITVVASAGNSCYIEVYDHVPAGFPDVIAVASSNVFDGANSCDGDFPLAPSDSASYFTSDGAFNPDTRTGITISAPGAEQEIYQRSTGPFAGLRGSCTFGAVGILSTGLRGGTARGAGTSMAAPHVTGVVALMWEQALASSSLLSPAEARSRIREGADRRGIAPLDNPVECYSFDQEREGILWAPGALGL